MSAEEKKAVLSVREFAKPMRKGKAFLPDEDDYYYCTPVISRIMCRQCFGKTVNNYILIYSGIIHTRLTAAHMTRRHQANSDNLHKFNFALSFAFHVCAPLCYRSRGCKAREREKRGNVCVKWEDIFGCSL